MLTYIARPIVVVIRFIHRLAQNTVAQHKGIKGKRLNVGHVLTIVIRHSTRIQVFTGAELREPMGIIRAVTLLILELKKLLKIGAQAYRLVVMDLRVK